ncbi:MAG: hypothetical protein M3458_04030 [Acidobacteriota bacterium]|nr:hypothetical protein [Acidobacteriota bacterium]
MNKHKTAEQHYRERECIHRQEDAEGDFYRGAAYVQMIQRLGSTAAMKVANNVTAFFWADAPHVIVWLCHNCAAELSLRQVAGGASVASGAESSSATAHG